MEQQERRNSRLLPTPWHNAVAGGVAGAVSRISTAPLDVAKIRCQLDGGKASPRYSSLLKTFRSVYAEEGLIGLWRGNPAAMALWIAYTAVQFGLYPLVRDALSASRASAHARPRQTDKFLAGAAAACVATTCTYPLDVMRTAFAGQGVPRRHPTLRAFAANTLHVAGVRGFYAGLSAALVQVAPQMGIAFMAYEAVKDHPPQALAAAPGLATWWPGVAGFSAGLLSKTVVYPLDTLKKRVQARVVLSRAGDQAVAQAGNLRSAAATVWQEGAGVALYRGLVPALWKASLSAAVTFGTYEWVKQRLSDLPVG
eukprot:TRINITY_DN3004_c0_g1_i1.p1 TRINITY_DN3004_c0_g1~~TRINITY_DN3004_c0_g1_i1.p1  ORF type:complete len:312 (-),score=76.17 TRINITY_DN3004_c0_g1_i1:36-971(-)